MIIENINTEVLFNNVDVYDEYVVAFIDYNYLSRDLQEYITFETALSDDKFCALFIPYDDDFNLITDDITFFSTEDTILSYSVDGFIDDINNGILENIHSATLSNNEIIDIMSKLLEKNHRLSS